MNENVNAEKQKQLNSNPYNDNYPPYDFYRKGINEVTRGFFATIIEIIKKRDYPVLIVIFALCVFCVIAIQLIKKGGGIEVYASVILITTMIFVIGLRAQSQINKEQNEKQIKRKKHKKTEFSVKARSP